MRSGRRFGCNAMTTASLRRLVERVVRQLRRTQPGRRLAEVLVDSAMQTQRRAMHNGIFFDFATPNALNDWRVETFSTKEPETLRWIDAIPCGATLWDIGANVGLYSCYAAKARDCRVVAFEPSVFNLELLARNLFLNGLTGKVTIVPLALSDALASSVLRMTTTEWGGALSTFGREFGWDGKDIRQVFEFRTLGLSMDEAVERLQLPMPEYVKMDVDGLEHFILQGGPGVLSYVKGVLIEVNDDFREQAEACRRLLTAAGLAMTDKLHSDMIAASESGFQNSYNQIWQRP